MQTFRTKKAGNRPASGLHYAVPLIAVVLAVAFLTPQQASAESCVNLPIDRAIASGHQTGSYPHRAIDNDPKTGWANNGIGSWIQVDLGRMRMVCSADIAWYKSDVRVYHFAILTSVDGTSFKEVYIHGRSSGNTAAPENYSFEPIGARYVKIKVYGNTDNNWAAIMEIDVQGRKIDPALLEGKVCSDDWNITAYFTPIESDYAGTGSTTVMTDEGERAYYAGFVEEIMMQGSGLANDGSYLGYWGGGFHISEEPRGSSGMVMQVGYVATDTSVIPYFTEITMPYLKDPWNQKTFTAADTGPAIIGKHLDVYTGIGLDARAEAFRIAEKSQTVCY
ncbi:discoidin domain-containing protein [Nitrososphaera sp.]|uniref:discoidin domain-containing protein n=1 Tax=Nitrososphaera sp. TaxID=1971748 RepID=UPI00317AB806